ncbi:MAG: DEAD/DEAH box helicase family protein, partial [Desulfobacterales bacterium]|nr:DEAD/DEAH box helicase family protein [Desulfobacterales bacterium]
GQKVWYCPECANMGESLSCRPIFRRKDRSIIGNSQYQKIVPHYSFPLSQHQKKVSDILSISIENQVQKRWLVWAVCGAGKTETTFSSIAEIIGRGGRVLFTSPRREVICQLADRLNKAFPSVSQIAIFGGSQRKLAPAQLTIATIHQLVRYYQAFDLVIFDEPDAFPYSNDQRLHGLLERCLKATGRLVYLSATPGGDLLNEVKSDRLEIVTLPARYHRKGVPVPSIEGMKLPFEFNFFRLPESLKKWIRESIFKELAQLYIFLPTREMVEQFGESLLKYFEKMNLHRWVEYTHSKDVERQRKVERFLAGEFPILVTTTILERGVTVPKSNVLVLYADYERIFNYQSLIQMAGRAGRSLYAPDGLVKFVGRRISKEMVKAEKWIKKMNQLAKERGLLDVTDS